MKKHWTNSGMVEGKPDYQDRIEQSIKRIAFHFGLVAENINCKNENHKWNNWSSHLVGKLSEGGYSCRVCDNCGLEMPNSREGEKDYLSFNDYAKKELSKWGNLVKKD